MESNGWGMCKECMNKVEELDGEEFQNWLDSLPRFSGQVK